MSDTLQIPRPWRVVHDAINVHLNSFEKTHPDHFNYDCIKEGLNIQRFVLRFERRPYYPEYSGRLRIDLGYLRLRPLSTSLTEMVMEDSAILEHNKNPFLNNVKEWEDELDNEYQETTSPEKAEEAANARFDLFKTIHQEVRQRVIAGLREDGILLGKQKVALSRKHSDYVDAARIAELRQLKAGNFDLHRLIRLCEELNKCFKGNSFCATAALVRAVIDHVPPIFAVRTFAEVANNVGGKSTKACLLRLETSSRNIADAVLHQQIRKREVVPNSTQVNFSNDLDVLLGEIIRRLS